MASCFAPTSVSLISRSIEPSAVSKAPVASTSTIVGPWASIEYPYSKVVSVDPARSTTTTIFLSASSMKDVPCMPIENEPSTPTLVELVTESTVTETRSPATKPTTLPVTAMLLFSEASSKLTTLSAVTPSTITATKFEGAVARLVTASFITAAAPSS